MMLTRTRKKAWVQCLSLCVLLVSLTAGSIWGSEGTQIAAGGFALSGRLSVANYSGDLYVKTTGVRLDGSLGYFIRDRLMVGALTGVSRVSRDGSSGSVWGVGPQIAIYLGPVQRQTAASRSFAYFGVGYLYLGSSGGQFVTTAETDGDSGHAWIISGGLVRMVTNTAGIVIESAFEEDKIGEATGHSFGVFAGLVGFLR